MQDYIDRFKSMQNFAVGEELAKVSGVPSEYGGVKTSGNWKDSGWAYTSIRTYITESGVFKDAKAVIKAVEAAVIGPNKKEWKALGVTPAGRGKGDFEVAYEHPGLGVIFFKVWSKQNYYDKYEFQVQGYFMNGETYWGKIESYPDLKNKIDDMMSGLKFDDNMYKAMADYVKDRYTSRMM
jgi:hypothetical protein